MKATATLPDGSKKSLMWIKDWDFNWQGQYQYKKPVHLPKGTTISMEYTYDNSADNERNPNTPPKRVTFGEQTVNEMAFLFLQAVTDDPKDLAILRLASLGQALKNRFNKQAPAPKPEDEPVKSDPKTSDDK
jgi:hypothetical protein